MEISCVPLITTISEYHPKMEKETFINKREGFASLAGSSLCHILRIPRTINDIVPKSTEQFKQLAHQFPRLEKELNSVDRCLLERTSFDKKYCTTKMKCIILYYLYTDTVRSIRTVSCIRLDPLKANITRNYIFEMIKRQTEHPMYMDLFRMLIFRRMVISNLSIVQEIPYFMEGTMNKHPLVLSFSLEDEIKIDGLNDLRLYSDSGRTRLTLDRAPARRRHGVSRLVFAVRSALAFTFSHGGNEKKPSSSALPPPPPSPPPCDSRLQIPRHEDLEESSSKSLHPHISSMLSMGTRFRDNFRPPRLRRFLESSSSQA
ncbi:hypothetical protein HZH66_010851 [Vespula vulgaris]|uniref:Uncharacterized protein n=1 Tax=Vespula vulgaris TaxID=7454 RepID=A0A834MY68_VESVU|nr:hypothetical protein HZH66_010851 [Vespula vulgaris]